MSTEELVAAVRQGADPILFNVSVAKRDHDAAGELLGCAVRDARMMGYTWNQIGKALGISRQAAQQKFRKFTGG